MLMKNSLESFVKSSVGSKVPEATVGKTNIQKATIDKMNLIKDLIQLEEKKLFK